MAEIDRYYAYQSLFTGRTAVPKSEILKKLEIGPKNTDCTLSGLEDTFQSTTFGLMHSLVILWNSLAPPLEIA